MPKKKTQKKKIDGKYKIIGIAILVCLAEIFLALASNGYLPFVVNKNTISHYLTEKYNENFTFVRSGLQSCEICSYQLWKFADKDSKEFYVWTDNGTHEIKDDYQSLWFDNDISNYISNVLGNQYIVIASTSGTYTGKDEKYTTALEYMRSRNTFGINIYTTQDWGEYFNDVDKLKNLTDKKFVIDVYLVNTDEYTKWQNDKTYPIDHRFPYPRSQYYTIENHNVTKKD